MQIWKYTIPLSMAGADARIPRGGLIRHAGIDPLSGNPAVWIEVDPNAAHEVRRFCIVGTGHEVPYGPGVELKFIGTGINEAGFVWHIFEQLSWAR